MGAHLQELPSYKILGVVTCLDSFCHASNDSGRHISIASTCKKSLNLYVKITTVFDFFLLLSILIWYAIFFPPNSGIAFINPFSGYFQVLWPGLKKHDPRRIFHHLFSWKIFFLPIFEVRFFSLSFPFSFFSYASIKLKGIKALHYSWAPLIWRKESLAHSFLFIIIFVFSWVHVKESIASLSREL